MLTEPLLGLLVAAILGAALGAERSIAGKHAGMRTYALVSLGSALFSVVGTLVSYQYAVFSGANPLQLAGFVIVGIGFIGAGLAAMRAGENHVELTTATGIWVTAGVGMASGFGLYQLAAAATVLALLIFTLFLRLENRLRSRFGTNVEG
ncbi:hypothetical protein A2852_02485 [Candidatus Adlerbacteria bacterium RIFCSPHIGHO2_01_FULL_54_23]|uniref:MgtC/SapB/SrpB/YhiD N-terminal domain-containing protein n=3 Tax=Candidatus Adleribacteriota TaxID=1752736 RepID=A0A1F4Y138_9BACT|nr:MAG: hypothetical protein UY83_C0002G0029 [Candidatus Adlerbacteria bacterium GW2011_GWA1_54_10]KKW37986.1 MAG: hypothetical protein UY86_C0002G0083 [Candidatus Adlerbacteria bacterium GW2011_GWB1_54_7]OGC78593.1 MAG: hypothetical protein A2852_02485 [Candidatus Adlerbacteria bacterium RIFCSPHIGHO2_01_FULL_54_23]OGC87601.1 MAG: hypothetical protein A3B33_01680 [Candidatus Adlerbacteria bacterium RIFCSPLOWO2_01_FULL_54_16]